MTRIAVGAIVVLTACGPKVAREEEWMLGVFSVAGRSEFCLDPGGSVTHYHVNDDHTFVEVKVGAQGPTGLERHYRWEPRGRDTFAVIPAEGEELVGSSKEWLIHRGGPCGPYEAQEIWQSGDPGGDWTIIRGAVCIRAGGCEVGDYAHWCEAPPEPCEE